MKTFKKQIKEELKDDKFTQLFNEERELLSLSIKILEERNKLGISQKDLAKKADENGKLYISLFPKTDPISRANTTLWKRVMMPLRDKVSDWIAGKMQAGLKSQTDAIRAMAKFGEMAYRPEGKS